MKKKKKVNMLVNIFQKKQKKKEEKLEKMKIFVF